VVSVSLLLLQIQVCFDSLSKLRGVEFQQLGLGSLDICCYLEDSVLLLIYFLKFVVRLAAHTSFMEAVIQSLSLEKSTVNID
jgi:hypothetical protein